MPWTVDPNVVIEKKLNPPPNSGYMIWATVTFVSDDPATPPIKRQIFGDDLSEQPLYDWIARVLASLNACDAAFAAIEGLTVLDQAKIDSASSAFAAQLAAQAVK